MDLLPYNYTCRDELVKTINAFQNFATTDAEVMKKLEYVVRTFPDIMLDVVRLLTERAVEEARLASEPAEKLKIQLRPYILFAHLLGKSPQITSLMYSYFENGSFQPLPIDSFQIDQDQVVSYNHPGLDDDVAKDILVSYLKYLSFNPRWFGAVWNWSELARYITIHPNRELRYLATCCLSIITKPDRHQHIGLLQDVIPEQQMLIQQQLKHASLFETTFRPIVETLSSQRRDEFMKAFGTSPTGYPFGTELLAKVTDVLLMKRVINLESEHQTKHERLMNSYIPVQTLHDTISKIAYAISVNKPCLIRGPTGTGKTAVLDYIAAHTNRLSPPDYVKVQVGDQIDSKSLVGSYVCTEIPGQFEWQPGPLTQAMSYGSWIVFEDIDSAPAEMAQVIHSVIENGNLSCVSCCPIKMENPHPDFKIFFTQRMRSSLQEKKLGFGFIERLCDIIDLPELSDQDLLDVIEKRYRFGPLTDMLLKLYNVAKASMAELMTGRALRQITLRDLFKLCDRISACSLSDRDGKYTSKDIDAILRNASDCFGASLSHDDLSTVLKKFGSALNKPLSETVTFLIRRPDLRITGSEFTIGGVRMTALTTSGKETISTDSRLTLARTRQSLQLLESVSASINNREPVLLVGETGVGKTTIVQNLANLSNCELEVINLSQQSDSSDLLGGYRPVEMREIMRPLHESFNDLFGQTFNKKDNKIFLDKLEGFYLKSKKHAEWLKYLRMLQVICTQDTVQNLLAEKFQRWKELLNRVRDLTTRLSADESSPMALAFSDGALLKAVRQGKWLLLDEINLAEPDVLQCLLLILDSLKETHVYMHTGSERDGPALIHPNFRVFACMNPSTDVGKRDLPMGIRARFTELFVDDVLDPQDLRSIIESYVGTCLTRQQIETIVNFYREIRSKSGTLSDISGNSPVYSLRTLCRAMVICAQNVCRNTERSLLESLKITFLQQLNNQSVIQVLKLMEQIIFKGTTLDSISKAPIQKPQDNHNYIEVEGFWIQTSSQKQQVDENYILTKSVRNNLERLCRILCLGQRKLPILIQGDTSVGKTSLIKYLAKLSGNVCFRINNHDHTDLQDYVGRYVLRENGELQFREGLLVTAMKKGYWVILDELNLAPSELLEALNRVLDDNRELFIPETGETIKAHSKFTLFATQNPPHEYAGRKLLSRAFRNRFIELHFDEIPHNELEEILQKRCKMAPQYAKKIVTVMRELQIHRRESGCFGGKNSFMTIRDLFRWGQRYLIFKDTISDDKLYDWNEHLAKEGLILLEGRVRTTAESTLVHTIITKVFKCDLKRDGIYDCSLTPEITANTLYRHIHLTDEFRRMFVQLTRALEYREPVLLCGQTGCGKTTATQLHAVMHKQKLITYNCHLNTECSDFIGNVRPSRSNDATAVQTFPWHDGPLVQAMREGATFLMDEISLADDAVLERINSILEPERLVTLTELDGEEIVAKDGFQFIATMNPGGDYGKKELSPALRNRFTEIYCHNTADIRQMVSIVEKSLVPALLKPKIAPNLLKIISQFLKEYYKGQDIISIRDVLNWTKFLNKVIGLPVAPLSLQEAVIHGASLVYFDQFGTCGHSSIHSNATSDLRDSLRGSLQKMVLSKFGESPIYSDQAASQGLLSGTSEDRDHVRIGKFALRKGPKPIEPLVDFIQDTPTVEVNSEKLIRALQLDRPILLEGDPGAGKTSIVAALARQTGHDLVRINLSEQTDISDLFGADLPDVVNNSDDDKPRFRWHDGPMLKAIKESGWILLDEMNLASQSVLEGLNACFDHRGEIFIPELDKTFSVDRNTTRIFACQNPYSQGAARKGLPKSFLNRFTSIYIEAHKESDLIAILSKMYSQVPSRIIERMVQFNDEVSGLYKDYEFNLRDLIHWCDLMTRYVRSDQDPLHLIMLYEPERFVQFVYMDRMRSLEDKNKIFDLFEKNFGYPPYEPPYRDLKVGDLSLIMARAVLPRKTRLPPHLKDLCVLKYQMPFMESVAKAIEFDKMPILVGEPGVGKRSIVRILAGITGNELNVIGANRDMDTVELLGSFEQKSVQRQIVDLVDEAVKFAISLINATPRCQQNETWSRLYEYIWLTLKVTSRRELELSDGNIMDAYRYQIDQMEKLIDLMQPMSINQTEHKCKEWKEQVARLKRKTLFKSESTYASGNFEWVDSLLIKSIREGSWLMIENANLMNPATLDRLNSLVEPNGTLSLNEKGSGPDGVEVLRPHPNFRLILTMNSDHGELSRAMRNRGVEIYVRTRFFYEDFLILLNQNGFVPFEQKSCMTYCIMQTSYAAHKRITNEKPEDDGRLLAYFGLNYVADLANQIRRGVDVETILSDLLLSFYQQKHQLDNDDNDEIRGFIMDEFKTNQKLYIVALNDSRYQWCQFRHDLVSITGGDAIPAMLQRESKILREYFDPLITGLVRIDEAVEAFDVVVVCTSIKLFMESSTHSDFAYRREVVKNTFAAWPDMVTFMESEFDTIEKELLPKINCIVSDDQLASHQLVPSKELYVDTRNSLDFHFYLQSINFKGASEAEELQNRWILSLHRISLLMIVEMVESQSQQVAGVTSLYSVAEQVSNNTIQREDLIRPQAEIAKDLHDLLRDLLQVVSNREYPNSLVTKMMARTFWIAYMLCKLRRAYTKIDLIAHCNELPMLWTLTYQKTVMPLIKDCNIADLVYTVNNKNQKFSTRIEHINDFLDVVISKPSKTEGEYYKRILNLHAAPTKRTECISREINKLFNILLARYAVRSDRLDIGSEMASTLVASNLPWSNSSYMTSLYDATEMLAIVDLEEISSPDNVALVKSKLMDARKIVVDKRTEYDTHEKLVKEQSSYRYKCLYTHRRCCAMDQFAPIWQTQFILRRLSRMHPDIEPEEANYYVDSLRKTLVNVNGLVVSPRYASTLHKLLHVVMTRIPGQEVSADSDIYQPPRERQNIDMYSAFVVDHLLENIVLDGQVVGWVKMRVTTSDLATAAPLMPEHCPIISLVSSYCLDISHMKLNSYQGTNPQLDSMLLYLWRDYASIKLSRHHKDSDLVMAKNHMHLRQQVDDDGVLVGDHQCVDADSCTCIDKYIARRLDNYNEIIKTFQQRSDSEDKETFIKSIQLIYYGFYTALEYAPIFTIDPSLRSREKMDVYKAELAHVKADLFQRNALYYWRTGENLRLVDMPVDEAKLYPMSIRALVERRVKLERSIKKLRRVFTNRPKTDDGSLYFELKKDVEVFISRTTNSIKTLISDLTNYLDAKTPSLRSKRVGTLASRCRMLIKSIEKTIARMKSEFALYTDLTTNYLAGFCLMMQGMRLLYARLEQKLQLTELGFMHGQINRFSRDIMKLFSFNNSTLTNMESVNNKRRLYPILNAICPDDAVSHVQSLVLKAALMQLNYHIVITPSDIEKCIPIVHNIADHFHQAWLERKKYLEEQRQKQEELYQFKTSKTRLDDEPIERREFIEICTKFPLYDHHFSTDKTLDSTTSAEKDNLDTEAKIINLNRSVDLSMCIDVCKAHCKFMKEASRNLLEQHQSSEVKSDGRSLDMSQLIKIEAEVLYLIVRKCIANLDKTFDAQSVECHLLQANELIKTLSRSKPDQFQVGTLRNSIEILDEQIFDIYYDECPQEVLKFKSIMAKVEDRINIIRSSPEKGLENHDKINKILKLNERISSFLITDPLMKFVTAAHNLLTLLDDWNNTMPRECRMRDEQDCLHELIQEWRTIENKSWRSSLHRVKRKYIDDTLCDLWFSLYEYFKDPVKAIQNEYETDEELEAESIYLGFASLIKMFLEKATLGDYQIRLDLVFAFTIQTRFAQASQRDLSNEQGQAFDYEQLTTYIYNIYRQYQGLMAPTSSHLDVEEANLLQSLNNEIKLVNWTGRNLWDIKNSFRTSHRKLNKVMNEYLNVLKRPAPGLRPDHCQLRQSIVAELPSELVSVKLQSIFDKVQTLIDETRLSQLDHCKLLSLSAADKIINRMKKLSCEVHPTSKSRFVSMLQSVENVFIDNAGFIKTFYSHRAQDLVILPKDSKKDRQEKMKTCRQILHTKRYALQALFKNLRELGMSHQRGHNISNQLDKSLASLEPLRGMIQNQSDSVLKSASSLVDDQLITVCNQMYRELVMNSLILLSQNKSEDISSDQLDRIRGYNYDIVLDIVLQNKNAAMVYRHLMDIQAATTRFCQLREQSECEQIHVYKFSRVHNSIRRFDEIVSRAISSMAKLEIVMDSFKTYWQLQTMSAGNDSNSSSTNDPGDNERATLRDLINETDKENSLMTPEQYEHLQEQLTHIRKSVNEVSATLRDKLRHTIRNYLFSDDDIREIQQGYQKFVDTLRQVLRSDDKNCANVSKGTVLGSLKLLREEAERKLKPILQTEYFKGGHDQMDLEQHANLTKLDIRLQKLLRQTKMSIQEIYKDQREFDEVPAKSEAAKRNMKPFNHIDSSKIRNFLRPLQVSRQVSSCFMTLNLADASANIKPIITQLTPVLVIYTQQMARYLNVILSSMHLKLLTANQIVPFFTDLVLNGFGLPCRIQDLEAGGQETSSKTDNDDNVGFGEGEGDTDASKKIEFESQLDELKKDGDDKNKDEQGESEKGPETKDIEAHDDGVEMSDDFEARPEGAGDTEQDPGDDEEDCDGDDQERIDELDKEFDEVDQDEGHLEQQLWDDKDEPLGEDDEKDLREAEVEPSTKPEMDGKDLMAKDADLRDAPESTDDTTAGELDETDNEVAANAADENQGDDEGEEASAENGEDGSEAPMEFEEISDVDVGELSDMDIQEDAQLDESAENKAEEDIDIDGTQEPNAGETSLEIDVDDSKEQEQQNKPAGDINESMVAESDIDVEACEDDKKGTGKMGQDSRGAKGDSTEDNEEMEDQSGAQDEQNAPAAQVKDEKTDQTNASAGAAEGRDEKDEKAGDQDAADDDDDHSPGKRTFGDQASLNQASMKRQKIESASPSANRQKRNDEKVGEPESVRHVDQAQDNDIEVIDLASGDDDELLVDDIAQPEQMDSKQQSIKPRGLSETKQTEKGDQEPEGSAANADNQSKGLDQERLQSSYNTNLGLLKFISHGLDDNVSSLDTGDLMEQIDSILKARVSDDDEHESVTTDQLTRLWLECTRSTDHLVQELCQQLQVVLQPTKMSKYKGDYKSGKRLNMRKIISYIASHYRKDKIWLRRTKPCKRTYNIALAVDNSSSMSENNCRQMTYQSLALLAKSLSFIEAGSLNVVSFGKQVKCIHEFSERYADAIGAQWLRELRFGESSTSYKDILRHSYDSFAKQAQVSLLGHQQLQTGSGLSVNQLLIIISDGRNVTSESDQVKLYLRQLKSMGVLTLFVIIDDPKQNGNKSIVDIKKSSIGPDGKLTLENYMDSFPFPFYVILRQIETMPSILGDALRQWFELVSNGA